MGEKKAGKTIKKEGIQMQGREIPRKKEGRCETGKVRIKNALKTGKEAERREEKKTTCLSSKKLSKKENIEELH